MDIKRNLIAIILFIAPVVLMTSMPSMAAKPVVISMYDKYFDPASVTVSPGQKVIWINKGKLDHTVTSSDANFDSGHIPPGSSTDYRFTKPGTYSYRCTLHSFMSFGMKGKIIVK